MTKILKSYKSHKANGLSIHVDPRDHICSILLEREKYKLEGWYEGYEFHNIYSLHFFVYVWEKEFTSHLLTPIPKS